MAPDRVLIVDDQPLFREAFSAVIARVTPNATFVEAASHRELLMRLAGGEPFALLFLDLALLGANCFDELAKLRKRRPETATVVVSARSDWPTIQRAMACGIAGYIPNRPRRRRSKTQSDPCSPATRTFQATGWLLTPAHRA